MALLRPLKYFVQLLVALIQYHPNEQAQTKITRPLDDISVKPMVPEQMTVPERPHPTDLRLPERRPEHVRLRGPVREQF